MHPLITTRVKRYLRLGGGVPAGQHGLRRLGKVVEGEEAARLLLPCNLSGIMGTRKTEHK